MQIDGHHTLTYIAARLAGFSRTKASIIAYSAQYVDDATNSGVIHFKNGAMYKRISSAHKMLDYRNSDELANHRVWIPFHFLPGNGGKQAGENPNGTFIRKLVCKPTAMSPTICFVLVSGILINLMPCTALVSPCMSMQIHGRIKVLLA